MSDKTVSVIIAVAIAALLGLGTVVVSFLLWPEPTYEHTIDATAFVPPTAVSSDEAQASAAAFVNAGEGVDTVVGAADGDVTVAAYSGAPNGVSAVAERIYRGVGGRYIENAQAGNRKVSDVFDIREESVKVDGVTVRIVTAQEKGKPKAASAAWARPADGTLVAATSPTADRDAVLDAVASMLRAGRA